MSQFRLFMPEQAVGANLVYFDLFNASGSARELFLMACLPVIFGETAVTGILGVDLFLTRTSTVGTTGTAASNEGTSLTAATFTNLDGIEPVHASITARLAPGGGAAAGAVISCRSVFTEETSAGTYVPAVDMVKVTRDCPDILIPEGSGIRVVQGSVASVGNIGFDLVFRVKQK